jgi:hypothetical protein
MQAFFKRKIGPQTAKNITKSNKKQQKSEKTAVNA